MSISNDTDYGEEWSTNGDSEAHSQEPVNFYPKESLRRSGSALGLDSMIENRKEQGLLMTNVVHIEVPFGKPIQEVYDGVHDGPVLGSGISGLVRKVTHKATGAEYAVKCLDLQQIETKEQLEQLKEEIEILCQLDHPNIVRLEEVYESHSEIYLVQELCLGGELFDRLDEQPDYHYTEGECARLVKQMLSSVRYLHSKGILHRDLKLENFLFSTERQSQLKMIDFGISKHFVSGQKLTEGVGTPYTVAPEVIRGNYDHKCDLWAIGVLAYLLLSGEAPFGGVGAPGENMTTVRDNILSGEFYFEPEDIWETVSPSAKDFICALLVTDPALRPDAAQAQKHQWLKEWKAKKYGRNDNHQNNNTLNPQVVQALLSFKELTDLHKLLCEVLSFTLLPDQIWDLRFEFEKMDTEGSGEISLQSLKEVLLANATAGSLGSLTEQEVEDIFNAMRVRSTTHSIKWHEFIAASLSQCKVDERNLRLAFDRLDSDHKGFITVDDMLDLLGEDGIESEDAMQEMWADSLQKVNKSRRARITYHDFVLMMKGQTMDVESEANEELDSHVHGQSNLQEEAQPSIRSVEKAVPEGREMSMADIVAAAMDDDGVDFDDDDDDDDLKMTSWSEPTHVRGHRRIQSSENYNIAARPMLRARSNSFCIRQRNDTEHALFTDFRRAMMLPERDQKGDIEQLIKDENPLEVNRKLYRAHRQSRQSIMEATKRIEEKKQQRDAAKLLAQNSQPPPIIVSPSQESENSGTPLTSPGLVMRHKAKEQPEMSQKVRAWIEKNSEEQTALVEKANESTSRASYLDSLSKSESAKGHKRSSSDVMEAGNSIRLHEIFTSRSYSDMNNSN